MINLALVGVGSWGKNFINEIDKITDCNLKYISAFSEDTLNSFSDRYIKVKNLQSLYNYKDIDGVIIATPGSTHFEIASQLLEKGYNLFIEKPMTTSYVDALRLKEISQSNNAIVLIGHVYLYNPAVLKIKELLSGIGQIQYITFEGLNNGTFRSDISALWEWAPHGISICLDFLGQTPKTISAWTVNKLRPDTKLYDLFILNLEFPNNIKAFIKGSWLYPVKKRELVVVGSNSTIIFNDCLDNKKITLYEGVGPSIDKESIKKNEAKISYPDYDKESALSMELLEFIECIKDKRTPRTDINHGVEVIKIIDLAEQSIRDNSKTISIT